MKHLISAPLWVAVPSSIAVAGVYLLIAPYISSLLNDPNLTGVLRVVDLSLPFMAVSSIMVSVSRGLTGSGRPFIIKKSFILFFT